MIDGKLWDEQMKGINDKRMEIAKALFSPQNWQYKRNSQQVLRLAGELVALAAAMGQAQGDIDV